MKAPASPYKGLAAFEDSDLDALLFFGREHETAVIAANLMASRLTVLYGPSGVGKSSVLRAGVAYRLRQEDRVHLAVFSTWTGDPVAALVEAVGEGSDSLADALEGAAARAEGDLYLVLDQFEELFLYHPDGGPFGLGLAETVRRPGCRVNVLIGIREDSLARLDVLKAAIPGLLSNRLRLEPLDRRAGAAAVVGPLKRYNELVALADRVEIEPALTDAILDQLAVVSVDGVGGRAVAGGARSGERIEPPYLQLVLTRLWDVELERGSRVMRLETLRDLGGAGRIVEDHLEHAMAELSAQQKDAAAALYNFLVTPSGTKIAHDLRDLAGYAQLEEDDARDVLQLLAAERIVRASSENGTTRYEIYHDVLADAVAAWRSRHRSERAVHEAEQRRRRALGFAIAALVGLLIVAGIAVFALVERSNSSAQARRAHARELAAASTSEGDSNPERSLRLAVQAAELEPRQLEEYALRAALIAARQRAVMRAGAPVRVAEFDPRGRFIATGSADGRVRIYRAGATTPARVLDEGGPITALSFAPNDQLLTAGTSGTAEVRDPRGVVVAGLRTGGPVSSASFGAGGRRVLTLTSNGFIRVWRASDGRLLRSIRVHGKALPRGGSLDRSGNFVVTVGQDRFARMYAVETGSLVHVLPQTALVHCAVFSPDGSRIATCGHEGVVRIWSRAGRLLRRLTWPESTQPINSAAFSPDGTRVAAAVHDGTSRLWNARSGLRIATMFGHLNAVTSVAFDRAGHSIVTGGADNEARTWSTTGKPLASFPGHTAAINSVAFSPDGARVLTASEDGTARIWEAGTQSDLKLVARQPSITSFALSSDGRRVAVGDAKGVARVRPVSGSRVLASMRIKGPVKAVAFGPEGLLAAALPTSSLAVSKDGRLVAHGMTDGSVVVEDTVTTARRVLHIGKLAVTALAFSPDRQLLATGASDGALRIWELPSGALKHRLAGHALGITSVSFSPDGSVLLSAGIDHQARTWEVRTGRPGLVLPLHFGAVTDASFSPDGRWIVTAGCCGASVIRASTGQRMLVLRGHRAGRPLVGAGFAGLNGRLVVTAAQDGTIRSFRCETCGGVDELIALAKRRLKSG